MAAGWGLPPMEWLPEGLEKDGMLAHVTRKERNEIYNTIHDLVTETWPEHTPVVALCKEPLEVRRAVGVNHEMCNCGPVHQK